MNAPAGTAHTPVVWTRPSEASRELRGAARRVLAAGPDAAHRRADVLVARNELALSQLAAGETAAATARLEALTEECTRVLGADHPDTLVVRGNLAAARLAAGQARSASTELTALVADRSRVLGDTHPSTLNARLELSMALLSAGRREAASGVLKPTLALLTARHGTDHPLTRFAAGLLSDARAR